MFARHALDVVRTRLRASPAVALIGPRQCGKTTLAHMLGGSYFDLEQETDRLRLDLDWHATISGDRLVILDEAQAWPELFPRLRGAIDEDRTRYGRFLLLGSIAPALMTRVSESLAGRLSLVELTVLLRSELELKTERERHWLCGGYPDGGVRDPSAFPRWQNDYLSLLTQRDLPEWGLPARPKTTERLFRMLAALHGQPWNASQLGSSLGLSYHTVNAYLDTLEGAFLVRRVPSHQANLKKRLLKRPRVYLRDSGLLHALLGVMDGRSLLAHPLVGASWEGHVIEQIIGELSTMEVPFDATWFRTSDGQEIDLVLKLPETLWAIEVKLTSSPSPGDIRKLDAAADLVGATHRTLVSRVETPSGGTPSARSPSAGIHRSSENLDSFLRRLHATL